MVNTGCGNGCSTCAGLGSGGPVSVFFQTLEMSVERRFRLDKVSFEDGRGRVMVPDSIG